MNTPRTTAESISRKLRAGSSRTIGVSGKWGFFQEEIRQQLVGRDQDEFDFVEFDAWQYSDGPDLVFTMLGCIAAKASARKVVAQETVKKIAKVLTYVGASALLKATSGVGIGDIEKAFQNIEGGWGAAALNPAEQARAQLKLFFDEENERKLVVLVSNLEKADKTQIETIFNAVRYLSKVSDRLFFVIFFDDTLEHPIVTSKLFRLCDSLIHLPHVTQKILVEGIVDSLRIRNGHLQRQEIKNVEFFLSVVTDIRGMSRQTIERAIWHFESSLPIIRKRTFSKLYLFVLALKYQFPEVYRWIMEDRRDDYEAWHKEDENRAGQALISSIEAAEFSYYPNRRDSRVDLFGRLGQVINEGEKFGI